MDVNIVACPAQAVRPELGSLWAVVSMMIDDQRAVVLHVTSALHGEGTTTVARELAAAAARANWCRVALIDGGPPEAGLPTPTPLLDAFERAEPPVLRRGRLNTADVALGCLAGASRAAPQVENVRKLYGWLRSEYTLSIIDCPPVLEARDTAVLASVADGTLLVVQAERTKLSDIRRAREILDQVGAITMGAVLNKRQRQIPKLLQRML